MPDHTSQNARRGETLFPELPAPPRIYRVPAGLPFASAFACGLRDRLNRTPPEVMARIRIFVSGRGEVPFLRQALCDAGMRLLPAIHSLRELAINPSITISAHKSVDRERRHLVLAHLVRAHLASTGDPTAADNAVRLADDLGQLLDTLHTEGVEPAALSSAVPGEHARHWEHTLRFLAIIGEYWPARLRKSGETDPEQCRALAAAALTAEWETLPPAHPVLVAGSTLTDKVTARFAAAIAKLPQGAVVLPGLDTDLDAGAWQAVAGEACLAPGHPQHTMKLFLERFDLTREKIPVWSDEPPQRPERTRFLGQALRPAPVTEAWLAQAPDYDVIAGRAMKGVDLVEAASSEEEASTIAYALREAIEDPHARAVFVTEDDGLRRRVLTKLRRWKLGPAVTRDRGARLARTPIGRYAILMARVALAPPDSAAFLALLKSAHCRAGSKKHWEHLRHLSRIERIYRRQVGRQPGLEGMRHALEEWAAENPERAERAAELTAWLDGIEADLMPLANLREEPEQPIAEIARQHLKAIDALAAPRAGRGRASAETRQLRRLLRRLSKNAKEYGTLRPADYPGFLGAMLLRETFLSPVPTHRRILVRGTLEARFDPPELVIFGGLNEDTAPGQRGEDSWLNRSLRESLGLPTPEQAIGTLAHDVSELFAAGRVVLTRARKTDGEEQVPSRWLLRLTNLLEGVGGEGQKALAGIRARGAGRLAAALRLDRPDGPPVPESQPCPRPPLAARPRRLSATAIETLRRDPYAIYARYILKLRPLEALAAPPDARLRGTLVHDFLAAWLKDVCKSPPDREAWAARFDTLRTDAFAAAAEWPWLQDLWASDLVRLRDWLVETDLQRFEEGWRPAALEAAGKIDLELDGGPFTITARADRIDSREGTHGLEYWAYDYKTGKPPNRTAIDSWAWQLRVTALILHQGGLEDLPPGAVPGARYIGLGGTEREGFLQDSLIEDAGAYTPAPDAEDGVPNALFEAALRGVLDFYDDPEEGYLSHALPSTLTYGGNYDHLARVAEWSVGLPAEENPTDG